MDTKFESFSKLKYQPFAGFSFSDVRICCFSAFSYDNKLNIFKFWTIGQTKQAIRICHVQF